MSTYLRCADIFQHFDRIGRPDLKAIYFAFDNPEVEIGQCAHPVNRFAPAAVIELGEVVAATPPAIKAELPVGHVSRGLVIP